MSCFCLLCFFFFSSRRRHTRSLCDWSSDVCSSDLGIGANEKFAQNDGPQNLTEATERYQSLRKQEEYSQSLKPSFCQDLKGAAPPISEWHSCDKTSRQKENDAQLPCPDQRGIP